jgi:hypothetical protein
LFFFAQLFAQNLFANYSQRAATVIFEVWISCLEKFLGIHKPWNIFDEFHLWTVLFELSQVALESKTYDDSVFLSE